MKIDMGQNDGAVFRKWNIQNEFTSLTFCRTFIFYRGNHSLAEKFV